MVSMHTTCRISQSTAALHTTTEMALDKRGNLSMERRTCIGYKPAVSPRREEYCTSRVKHVKHGYMPERTGASGASRTS